MILEMLPQKSQNQIICPPPNAVIARAIGAPIRRSVCPRELNCKVELTTTAAVSNIKFSAEVCRRSTPYFGM